MMIPYSDLICNWESSGSFKGNLLLNYAQKAFHILQNNKSVIFLQHAPLEKSEENETIALHFLSGGTGGQSEHVIHNSITLGAAVDGLIQKIEDYPLSSVCCLPLWHVGGWMQLERAWRTNGHILFCDFRDLLKPAIEEKMNGKWISLVPTQLKELVESKQGVRSLQKAKGIFLGGAAIHVQISQTVRKLELPVYPCYGSSETAGMVSLLESEKFLNGKNGVGQVLDHAQIRIHPLMGQLEIKASSLCLSRGDHTYSRGSWLQTADYGKLDLRGYLTIEGRLDRIINTGGEKVDPSQIEQILYSTGLVDECLVMGVPDEKWGQQVIVYLSPLQIDLQKVKKSVSGLLTGAMKPKEWKICSELPLTEMGKPKNYFR
jgi:O-succinylbenzoic acid--CoA ligase